MTERTPMTPPGSGSIAERALPVSIGGASISGGVGTVIGGVFGGLVWLDLQDEAAGEPFSGAPIALGAKG